MIAHFTQQNLVCARRVLLEAEVDMVLIGSDLVPMLGPNVIRDFFLDSYAETIALAQSHGKELVCLHGRGDVRPLIGMFRDAGVNGVKCIMETGSGDYLQDIMDDHGDSLFYPCGIDGRVLPRGKEAIDVELARKLRAMDRYRMIPCLAATHILPDVRFKDYEYYAMQLRARPAGRASRGR
jgi:hypothetical protein